MEKKLQCAMLIDEDKATNMFHKMVINRHERFEKVISVLSTKDALLYLEEVDHSDFVKPDVIFLDYGIPLQSIGDFFEKFNALEKNKTSGIKIFFLAPHSDQECKKKGFKNYPIDEFMSDPLTSPGLDTVLDTHFFNF
jgi:two-component SAPR family response regulator